MPSSSMEIDQQQQPPLESITFSEHDIKTRHPWLIESLYGALPIQCKTCGRRLHSNDEMSSHLDWHFHHSRRSAIINRNLAAGGTRNQQWFWDMNEWIEAEDVIFGAQKKAAPGSVGAGSTPAAGATGQTQPAGGVGHGSTDSDGTTSAGGGPGPSPSPDLNAMMRIEGMDMTGSDESSVIADENQKKCSICGDDFRSVWDDEAESWMYPRALRISSEMLTAVCHEIQRLESQKPTTASFLLTEKDRESMQPGQVAAFESKEAERQLALFRYSKLLQEHLKQYEGCILHVECHRNIVRSIMKSKKRTATTTTNDEAPTTNGTSADNTLEESPPPLE